MSATVDQRVVEMRFDNQHFERNVSTTMSTLDKLKQKLHLPGAAKGMEDVGNAAKKIDMSPVGRGVEDVRMKFSALQVMGVTALTNITNSAVNAGKRIMSALTIDPIKTGFSEYETQINATQTILANTKSKGSTIDDVNKALEELNAYADMTIYNFTEMTRNIGTFTAAGVDLETSVGAIQGIANLAAISGSTSQQASTAMYQLSQALSSGTVRLMDWNSVVNAGMGGEVFQTALKKTSEQLGTGAEAAVKASGSFRESLKDGWLTAEVLTQTLKKFTTSGANEYLAEYTGLSQDVVESYVKQGKEAAYAAAAAGKLGKGVTEEAYAIEYAAKALAEKSGKNQKEIQDTLDLAQTATGAATEVKTFTQLWEVMKESAQSGWAQSWKIIVGDFEQAKKLLTPLANTITGFIGKMNDARNRVLEIAFNFAKPWTELSKKLSGLKDLMKPIESALDPIKNVIGTLEEFQDIVNRVWMGEFNNWGDNPDRRDLLTAAGYDYRVVQYLVNLGEETWHAGKIYQLTMEDIEAAHAHYGLTFNKTNDQVAESNEAVTESIQELTDAQLEKMGLTEEEIRLYRALESEAKRQGKTMSQLADEMSKMSGRDRLIYGLRSLGKTILEVFSIAKTAYLDIFNPPGVEELGIKLFGIIQQFQEWADKLRATIVVMDEEGKATGELTKTGENLKRTFKGIFAALHIVFTLLAGPLKIAFKLITGLLAALDIPILDVTASVGDAIVAFDKWLTSILDFEQMFRNIFAFFKDFPTHMKAFWESFKQTEIYKEALPLFQFLRDKILGLVEAVKQTEAFKSVVAFFKPFLDGIKSWWAGLKEAENIPKYLFDGLWNGIKAGASRIWSAISGVIVRLIQIVKDVLGIESPSKVFMAIGGFIVAGLLVGLSDKFPQVWDSIGGFVDKLLGIVGKVDWGAILTGIVTVGSTLAAYKFSNFFAGLGSTLDGFGDVLSGIGTVMIRSAGAIRKVIKNTAKVIKSFSKVLNGVSWDLKAGAVQKMAIAVAILVGSLLAIVIAIKLLGDDGVSTLWQAVGVIAALAAIVALMAVAIGLFAKSSVSLSNGSFSMTGVTTTIMSIGLAMLMMAAVVAIVAGISWGDLAKGGVLMIAFGGLIAGLIAATKLAGADPLKAAMTIAKTSAMISAVGTAMLVLAIATKIIATVGWGDLGKAGAAIGGLGLVIGGLLAATRLAGLELDKAALVISKLGLAFLLLALAAKIIASMTWEDMGKAGVGILALGGIIVGLIAATKLAGGKRQLDTIGSTILGVAGAIALLAIAGKIIASMSWDDMGKAVVGILGLGVVVAGLIWATKLAGNKAPKIAATLLAIAGAIALLALVAIVLGFVNPDRLTQGVIAVGILALLVMGLVWVTSLSKNCKASITALAILIGVLGVLIIALAHMPADKLLAPTLVLIGVMGMLGILLAIVGGMKNSKHALPTLLSLAAILAVLGTVLIILSYAPISGAIAAAASIAGVLLALAGAVKILGTAKSIKQTLPVMIMMAVMIAVLGGAMVLLAAQPWGQTLAAAAAMSLVLIALAGAIKILGTAKSIKQTLPIMIMLSVIIAVLGATLIGMAMMPWGQSLAAAAGLVAVLLALAGAVKILSTAKSIKQTLPIMIMMTLMIAVLGGTMVLLAQQPWGQSLAAAAAMSLVLIALAGAFMILGNSKKIKQSLPVLALMIATIAVLGGVLTLLAMMPIANALVSAVALSVVLLALAGAMMLLGSVKTISPTTIASLLVLAAVIAVLGVVMTAIGGMGNSAIILSLVAIAGALVVLALALNLMNGTIAGSAALLVASVALIALAGAMTILGTLSWESMLIGLVAIAGVLVLLGAAGYLLGPVLPVIIGLSAALVLLGVTVVAIGAGILLLGVGFNLLVQAFILLGNTMATTVPQIVTGMQQLTMGFMSLIPIIIYGVGAGIAALCDVIIQSAPKVSQAILAVIQAIVNTITGAVPIVVQGAFDLVIGFINGIAQGIPLMIQAAYDFVITFINGLADCIRNNTPKVIAAVQNLIDAIIDAFVQVISAMFPIGGNIIGGLIDGIRGAFGKVTATAKELGDKVLSGIKSFLGIHSPSTKFAEVGKNIVDGLVNGIKNIIPNAIAAVKNLGQSCLDAICKVLGIASPSKEMFAIGEYMDMGLIDGLWSGSDGVNSAASGVASGALDAFKSAFSGADGSIDLGKMFNTDGMTPGGLIINTDGLVSGITMGASGDAVTALQEALNVMLKEAGLDEILVDGIWNSQTDKAFRWAEEQMGFTADGILSEEEVVKIQNRLSQISNIDSIYNGNPISNEDHAALKESRSNTESILAKFGYEGIVQANKDLVNEIETHVELEKQLSDAEKRLGEHLSKQEEYAGQAENDSNSLDLQAAYRAQAEQEADAAEAAQAEIDRINALITATSGNYENAVKQVQSLNLDYQKLIPQYLTDDLLDKYNSASDYNKELFQKSFAAGIAEASMDGALTDEEVRNLLSCLDEDILSDEARQKAQYVSKDFMYFLSEYMPELDFSNKDAFEETINSLTSSDWSALWRAWEADGRYSGEGYLAGLDEYMSSNTAEMMRIASLPQEIFKTVNQIQSPSKVFKELGRYIIEGLLEGLSTYEDDVPSVVTGLGKTIQNLFNVVNPDMEIQPTITPVLDLSNVESGISTMNGWLGGDKAVGLATSAGAISSMMNSRGQNGGNEDVVSAIDKLHAGLHDDIIGMDNNVYHIKGITYNDDNAVTRAVKLIVSEMVRKGVSG